MSTIFDPITIGEYDLNNRIIMAPLTRGRANKDAIPNDLMATYYAQRADAGLIISEATAISPQGYGWVNAPGIWNDEQVQGWTRITRAVHEKGGHIFLQLWHMGRVSHPDFLNGALPVAPSAIAAEGHSTTPLGKKDYVVPRALEIDEIKALPAIYAEAAQRAIKAGFDGVEVHAANGYLLDQFIRDGSNKRNDAYGGPVENRVRLLDEVTQAVIETVGKNKVGVRLSPLGPYNGMHDSDPVATFTYAAQKMNDLDIAYLHVIEGLPGHRMAVAGERVTPHIREVFKNTLILNGGYTAELSNKALENGEGDAVSFGIDYLANPDLVLRLKHGYPLNEPDTPSLYSGGEEGYTDYPFYQPKAA